MEPNETTVTIRPCDSKGRTDVAHMSGEECAREALVIARATQDLVESFIADFAKNPAFGMLGKMFGGR